MRTRFQNLLATWSVVLAPSLTPLACNVFQPPPDPNAGRDAMGADGTAVHEGGDALGMTDTTVEAATDTGTDAQKGDAGTNVDAGADGPIITNQGDGAPWWPHINSHNCLSAGVPLRTDAPAVSDPGDPLPPIYVAMSRFLTGTSNNDMALTQNLNAWKDQGFDIDNACTNSQTCLDPTDPSMQTLIDDKGCRNDLLIPYDGNLCRDNALGKSFGIAAQTSQVGQWFGFTEADFNCELLRGSMGVIFKISDYNGKLNDSQVRVDMYMNIGLVTLPSWKCRQTIDSPLDPTWPGGAPWMSTDPWIIASQSIDIAATDAGPNDLPNANVNDTSAYVRDGWLVAHLLPDGAYFWFDAERTSVGINALPGQFPGFRSTMFRSVFAARIVQGPDGFWYLQNGTLSWVEPAGDVLQAFRYLGFCENMCVGYQQLKNYLNTNLDAVTTGQPGQATPNQPCDGLSAGWYFEARQAAIAPLHIQPATEPVDCPEPLSMLAPRQGDGCNCEAGLGCPPDDASAPEAGADAAGSDSGADGGGD